MASLNLRDRDAIVTKEGLIFRVFGYSHPSNAFVCDAEYAPIEIFKSNNPKALRSNGQRIFYKFYEDEGWKFIRNNFPQHTIFHEVLQQEIVGVTQPNIIEQRKPNMALRRLVETSPKDELLAAMQKALEFNVQCSSISENQFGVFGSLLHGFHHPKFSDIDFTIYGGKNVTKLCETLQELYLEDSSLLRNEFETDKAVRGKRWRFRNLSAKEYIWHQRRKLIYALFKDQNGGRVIKTEFEPVKEWEEINNSYDSETRIAHEGWIRMIARIVEDQDAPFIPSVYGIEPLGVLKGTENAIEVKRVISYVEEFRMQAHRDEEVYIEGNLEKVKTSEEDFHQIALTYCPRYYKQVLKVTS